MVLLLSIDDGHRPTWGDDETADAEGARGEEEEEDDDESA